MSELKKLNLGAGRLAEKGYVNVDIAKLPGIDVVHDLNKYPWPFKNNEFDEIKIMGTLNLLDNFMKSMEEIWRISKPRAKIKIHSALFPSTQCAQDPFNKHFITLNSFNYFSPEKHALDYYTKAKFNIKGIKIIYTQNKFLKFLNFIPNVSQKFYCRFLFFLMPSNEIVHYLEAVK